MNLNCPFQSCFFHRLVPLIMQALSAAYHSPNLTVEEVSSAAFKIILVELITALSFQKVILTHSLPSWVLKPCLMSYVIPHDGVMFEYLFSWWLFQTKIITVSKSTTLSRSFWMNVMEEHSFNSNFAHLLQDYFFSFTSSMGNKDLTSNQGSVLTDSIASFRRTCYGRFRDVQSPSLVLGLLKKTICVLAHNEIACISMKDM